MYSNEVNLARKRDVFKYAFHFRQMTIASSKICASEQQMCGLLNSRMEIH
jgi:hypothetical protein